MPPVRRFTFDLDLDVARAMLARIDPKLVPTNLGRLHGGSNEVYRIDLAAAPPLVVKLYADKPVWLPAKERLVAGWIGEAAGLPIPRWIALDESRTLLPLRYAVTSWLPGSPLREHVAGVGSADAFRQAGRLLRRLHEIPMTAYGYILDEGIARPEADNDARMAAAFADAFARFRDLGGDAELARRLEQAVTPRVDLISTCARPVFLHDDFQPGNILVVQAGDTLRLSGLIDFGNAQAGDPLMDLAKAMFCCAHEHPPSVAPLREGYGPIDHPDPEGALWLYMLYHRMSMWAWLRSYGDAPDDLLRDLAAMIA